jgi:hypothetical protein
VYLATSHRSWIIVSVNWLSIVTTFSQSSTQFLLFRFSSFDIWWLLSSISICIAIKMSSIHIGVSIVVKVLFEEHSSFIILP